jgi:hypothetical protein
MLTIELVAHMDADDRTVWKEDQNLRPLSELGKRQAERFCEAVSQERIEACLAARPSVLDRR